MKLKGYERRVTMENKTQKAVKDILLVLAENEFTASEADYILESAKWMLRLLPVKKEFISIVENSDELKTLS
jgi:hypothetical protein